MPALFHYQTGSVRALVAPTRLVRRAWRRFSVELHLVAGEPEVAVTDFTAEGDSWGFCSSRAPVARSSSVHMDLCVACKIVPFRDSPEHNTGYGAALQAPQALVVLLNVFSHALCGVGCLAPSLTRRPSSNCYRQIFVSSDVAAKALEDGTYVLHSLLPAGSS